MNTTKTAVEVFIDVLLEVLADILIKLASKTELVRTKLM